MTYTTTQTKKSTFTTDDDITNSSLFDFIKAGVNKKTTWQNIIDQIAAVYGLGIRLYETESAMIADTNLSLGDHAIVEENRYAIYEVTNVSPVTGDVTLSNGLTAGQVGKVIPNQEPSYSDLKSVPISQLKEDEQMIIAYRSAKDDGGGGQFRWDSSDNSTNVTNDPGESVYIAPNSDATGASGCWVRQRYDVLSNVAEMIAKSAAAGRIVRTDAYYSSSPSGGARYLIKTASDAATDGDVIDEYGNHTLASGDVAILQVVGAELQTEQFGLSSTGTHANNKAAIESTLAHAENKGFGTISFKDYSTSLVSVGADIQLHRGIKLKMHGGDAGGAFNGGLQGDGTGPIFLTGVYTPGGSNTPSLIREITFENLSAQNTNGHPIAEIYSPNFKCLQGRYKTVDSETFKCRYAFRLTFRGGRHQSSWTAYDVDNFTITAYDNCNGMLITPDCIITGGGNGGGVDVSQSQKINIDFIGESMGNIGIRIAGYTGLEKGNCNSVRVAGYLEKCPGSVSLGAENRVTGVEFGEMFINQAALASTPPYAIEIGKVNGLRGGAAVSIFGHGAEPAILFNEGASGSGSLSPEDIYLEGVQVSTVGSNYAIDASLGNSQIAAAFNGGRIQIGDMVPTGELISFVSDTLTASVGTPADYTYIPVTPTSGIIESVEIIEATGNIDATLRIGDLLNSSRNFNLALDTSAPSNGYIDYTSSIIVANLRIAEPSLFRVIAGSGSQTFRLRIKYRV